MDKFDFKYRHVNCIYEGEHTNYKPHGYGKLYITDKDDVRLVYVGQWKSGKAHGKGKVLCDSDPDFSMYCKEEPYIVVVPTITDEFGLNKPNSFDLYGGSLINSDTYYYGDFCNGKIVGEGKIYAALKFCSTEDEIILNNFLNDSDLNNYEKYLIYSGQVFNGKCSGYGELVDYENREFIYKGYFKNSEFHGTGSIYWGEQMIVNGSFRYGYLYGNGELFHSNGQPMYKGEFSKDRFNGQGKEYDQEGALICNGFYDVGIFKEGYFTNAMKNLLFNRFAFFKKRGPKRGMLGRQYMTY